MLTTYCANHFHCCPIVFVRADSTGIKEKIQLSESTATLLRDAGKGHWVVPRADKITAKGKGEMQTYWLEMDNAHRKRNKRTVLSSTTHSESSSGKNGGKKEEHEEDEHVNNNDAGVTTDDDDDLNQTDHHKVDILRNLVPVKVLTKNEKLVSWACELLRGQIQKVAVTRTMNQLVDNNFPIPDSLSTLRVVIPTTPPIDEIVDYLDVPEFTIVPKARRELETFQLDTTAADQLHHLVTQISSRYNDNQFHNFEHACYVVMSVSKLLRRINPSAVVVSKSSVASTTDSCSIQSPTRKAGYTYGVYSDPITQLALLFSALIHDIDHKGVSNTPLMIEQPSLASMYKNHSVAEQNSIDIAWSMFMSDTYEHLRSIIFQNNEELWRFRRIVVNAVLATDILDQQSNEKREHRWKHMFLNKIQQQRDVLSNTGPVVYKKPYQAAIVVEYMMQASDVSHTMQHWLVFIKWNTNLFREVYTAYCNNRLAINPIEYWYQAELDFFDHYVIPLAQKLKSSNAFGSSITEYLTYAKKNRTEWAVHGQDIINETVRSFTNSVDSIALSTGSATATAAAAATTTTGEVKYIDE
jgi:3'5'-cyclic nucleotide phosphodiesterase/Adenylate and Guanylate cyclase catalytic domain